MEIKSILVGIDFSEGSRSALRYAVGLAESFGAKLVLVHVIDGHDLKLVASTMGVDEAEMLHGLREDASGKLSDFLASEAAGLDAESLIASGAPYHQIALKDRQLAADLIILGGQGMSRDRMAELFFGSTAEKVVRLLPCPVLCVPSSGK